MLEQRKMTAADCGSLKLEALWMYDNIRRYLNAGSGPAWVLVDEQGDIVSAGGMAFLWPGVCEVWFNLIRRKETFSQVLKVRRTLTEQAKVYQVRRYQAAVRVDQVESIRFARVLGFSSEGRLSKYTAEGDDVLMMARIES